ncbi:hypothetical protein [Chitinophaga rhizophila]|uniref:Cbb3-type cytochrome oxidase component FixQ n=1 Tax=Chitinophaga rhizophila TaxID=2866212 RepID=A0ABS7GA50_9BACT|nr:hypothetical protein [Chitinophaga rhizophila]MBW8684533.1 hypothetical protein [Chitinophaga rhizophila]
MRKKLFLLLALLTSYYLPSTACDACNRKQTVVFSGLTHGKTPDSQWDYLIVLIIAAIVLLTLFYSVKWLIRPGEKSVDHIKQFVVNNNSYEG